MVLKWRTAGQACTHANRVYVQSGVYEKFLSMLVNATKKIQVGHGAAPNTTMGALTTTRGLIKMEQHITDAISKGGEVVCGGNRLTNLPGNFFAPTIISGMTSAMLTSQEEIFGPLLGLYRFETEEEAVQMANDTSMGLGAYFFTKDTSRTWRLLESLEAGMVGMNTGNAVVILPVCGSCSPFNRKCFCSRVAFWGYQGFRVWKGGRQRCRDRRVPDFENWDFDC